MSHAAISIIASGFNSSFCLFPEGREFLAHLCILSTVHGTPCLKIVWSSQSNQASRRRRSGFTPFSGPCLGLFIPTCFCPSVWGLHLGFSADLEAAPRALLEQVCFFGVRCASPSPQSVFQSLSSCLGDDTVRSLNHISCASSPGDQGTGTAEPRSSPAVLLRESPAIPAAPAMRTGFRSHCFTVLFCRFAPSPSCLYPCRFHVK